MRTRLSNFETLSQRRDRDTTRWTRNGSATWLPMVNTGLRVTQGVLEDHGDLPAPDLAHFLLRYSQQIPAPEQHLTRDDAPGRTRHQPEDGEAGHALAAARLAQEAQRLSLVQRERDAVHGLARARPGEEVRPQVPDLEQRYGRRFGVRVHRESTTRRPHLDTKTAVVVTTNHGRSRENTGHRRGRTRQRGRHRLRALAARKVQIAGAGAPQGQPWRQPASVGGPDLAGQRRARPRSDGPHDRGGAQGPSGHDRPQGTPQGHGPGGHRRGGDLRHPDRPHGQRADGQGPGRRPLPRGQTSG